MTLSANREAWISIGMQTSNHSFDFIVLRYIDGQPIAEDRFADGHEYVPGLDTVIDI